MDSNFIPEALPNFLDLRLRIIDSFGRLNSVLKGGEEGNPRALATILGHQGSLLLRLEDTWAGLKLSEAPNLTPYGKALEVVRKRAA